MNNPNNQKNKHTYLYNGLTAFLVIAASVLLAFIVFNFSSIYYYIAKFVSVMQPLIIGFVIAYLINPFYVFFDKNINKLLKKKIKKDTLVDKISSVFGVFSALILFSLIIFVILYLVIPEFISCMNDLIRKLPDQIDALSKNTVKFLNSDDSHSKVLNSILSSSKSWLSNDFTPKFNEWAAGFDWANNIATGVGAVAGILGIIVNFLKNFVIGFIFAAYLLMNKKLYQRQSRKLIFAVFKEKHAKKIMRIGKRSHSVFSGFINGKLLDSAIIGVLCFIGVSILNMPYVMLIAVIIGVTNVIPVFGPYIGAVPCVILIFLNDPIKSLYFIIFIILLQTFDGNILGPKILGDRTGLGSIWVVIAIVICGGLFGVIGMLIGVPVFALLYYAVKSLVNERLESKNLTTLTDFYDDNILDKFGDDNSPEEIEDK